MQSLKSFFLKIKTSPFFYIALMSVFILAPIISSSYFDGHDTEYHAQSIVGLEQDNTIIGIFSTHIMQDMNGNFGYGEGIFYPQLSHQIAATILHVIKPFGGGVFVAMRITHLLGLVLSGFFMYFLMHRISKNKTVALLTAFFYMTFPYHLGDIIIRDAFAELFIFVFLPLLFLSLEYLLIKDYRKFFLLFVISYVGLINSHLILTVCITFFLILLSLFFRKQVYCKGALKAIAIAVVVVSLIVSPFIIPLLINYQWTNGGYVAFTDFMYNIDKVNNSRLLISDYFTPTLGVVELHKNIPVYLNLFALLLAGYTTFYYRRIVSKSNKFLLVSSLVIAVVCLIFSTIFVTWRPFPDFLLSIQFVWRLQTFVVFALSILAGFALQHLRVNLHPTLLFLTLLSCIFCTISVWQLQPDWDVDLYAYGSIDYYPVQLFDNLDYINDRSHDVLALSGDDVAITNLQDYGRTGLDFDFASPVDATLELPRLYYLGYTVSCEQDGVSTVLPYVTGPHGFITIDVPAGSTHISLVYTDVAGHITRAISAATLVAFIGYTVYYYRFHYSRA